MNLLPLSGSQPVPTSVGVYVDEGLQPVPLKLAINILRWDYVEMSEMLPEFWSNKVDDDEPKRPPPRRPHQVSDIISWIHCYASCVSVLASRYGDVPLMAYLVTITRVSQDYTGLAWVRYGSSFRRQAAIIGNKK